MLKEKQLICNKHFLICSPIYYLGNITVGNVLEVLPFGNEIDLVTLRGSTILKALEKSVEGWDPIDQSGAFLHFSGMFKQRYSKTCLKRPFKNRQNNFLKYK